MGTRINTNINALNALKSLDDIQGRLSISQLRLATGKRINTTGDDAAGYTIAKKFNARAEGLGQALISPVEPASDHLEIGIDPPALDEIRTLRGQQPGSGELCAVTAERQVDLLFSGGQFSPGGTHVRTALMIGH